LVHRENAARCGPRPLRAASHGRFRNHWGEVQSREMIPGSTFLWNLARWNQYGDDLRGVDALAIAGNAGTFGLGGASNATDGVVSLTSASIGFVTNDLSRTRILPYCHTDPGIFADLGMSCTGAAGIAHVDTTDHPTGLIVTSFLTGTTDWQSIGGTPATDPYLSQYGGVYFAVEPANGESYLSDLSSVLWRNVILQPSGAPSSIFYNEFVAGAGNFQAASASLGQVTYGPVTIPTGHYSTFRAKLSPAIFSVGPLLGSGPGRVVQSGGTITISGTGFGSLQCAGCTVIVAPSGSTTGYSLPISSWTDQEISTSLVPAELPDYSGRCPSHRLRGCAVTDSPTLLPTHPSFSCAPIRRNANIQMGMCRLYRR
jgi:hypothetical protein